MQARSTRLTLEPLEDRSVPSAVAYGDFNHDGREDVAAITGPTTITVSLANQDGGYTVSAILTAPTKQPVQNVYVWDYDGDGNLDISASGAAAGNKLYSHRWLGNGDGTFGAMTTDIGRWPPPPGHAKNWV